MVNFIWALLTLRNSKGEEIPLPFGVPEMALCKETYCAWDKPHGFPAVYLWVSTWSGQSKFPSFASSAISWTAQQIHQLEQNTC